MTSNTDVAHAGLFRNYDVPENSLIKPYPVDHCLNWQWLMSALMAQPAFCNSDLYYTLKSEIGDSRLTLQNFELDNSNNQVGFSHSVIRRQKTSVTLGEYIEEELRRQCRENAEGIYSVLKPTDNNNLDWLLVSELGCFERSSSRGSSEVTECVSSEDGDASLNNCDRQTTPKSPIGSSSASDSGVELASAKDEEDAASCHTSNSAFTPYKMSKRLHKGRQELQNLDSGILSHRRIVNNGSALSPVLSVTKDNSRGRFSKTAQLKKRLLSLKKDFLLYLGYEVIGKYMQSL